MVGDFEAVATSRRSTELSRSGSALSSTSAETTLPTDGQMRAPWVRRHQGGGALGVATQGVEVWCRKAKADDGLADAAAPTVPDPAHKDRARDLPEGRRVEVSKSATSRCMVWVRVSSCLSIIGR